MKIIKKFMFIFLIIAFLVFLSLEIWFRITEIDLSISSYIYWLILFIWLIFILKNKLRSIFSFYIAFSLFILATLIYVLGMRELAEVFMRVSFIGWLIAIGQALIEYRKER